MKVERVATVEQNTLDQCDNITSGVVAGANDGYVDYLGIKLSHSGNLVNILQ